MDYVFSTTQRLLGYVPEEEIWDMTPKHWDMLIRGARHHMIDLQEVQIVGAVAMARMNNGQNIRALIKDMNERRTLIDKSKSQHDYDKQVEKRRNKKINAVQKADLREWWDEVQESNKDK